MTDTTFANNYFFLAYKLEGVEDIPSNHVALMVDSSESGDYKVLGSQFMDSEDKSFSITVNDYPASGDVLTASFDGSVLDFDLSGVVSTDIVFSSFYCTGEFFSFMGGFIAPEKPVVVYDGGK